MTQRGRADFWDPGQWNTVCYECGRKRKAGTLKRHWQGYYVCPEHWEARQPQDFARGVPDTQLPPWVQPMPADLFDFEFLDFFNGDNFNPEIWFVVDTVSNDPLLIGT